MIERCYENERDFPSYYGISEVCEEWKNFQVFADWYFEHCYEISERLHIDKDIKYPGNKIYSPYHCLLVPQRINMLFANKQNKRETPNGIKEESGKYVSFYNGKELGRFTTIESAFESYARSKKAMIIKVANEYKLKIPDEVYQALLNYEIKIENDKNYKPSIDF